MEPGAASSKIYRFGLFETDVAKGTLTRNGIRVKLQDQPFRVLIFLLERPGEIVTRDELRQRLWPEGTYVDFDGSLNVILKKLRAAIDDDSDNPRFVETVPRRGYKFIAPVAIVEPESLTRVASPVPNGPGVVKRKSPARIWAIVAALVLAAVIALVAVRSIKKGKAATDVLPRSSLAVIPFSNGGAGPSFDYLRFALASDIVTDLSYARSISVRPFASTTKYADVL